jgi:hypothetical protein
MMSRVKTKSMIPMNFLPLCSLCILKFKLLLLVDLSYQYIAHHNAHYIVEYTDRFHVAFVLQLYSVHCREKKENMTL